MKEKFGLVVGSLLGALALACSLSCASLQARVGKEPAQPAPDFETVKYEVCRGTDDSVVRLYITQRLGSEPQATELLARAHKYADTHLDDCPCAKGACKPVAKPAPSPSPAQ